MLKSFDKKFGEDFLASVPTTPGVYRYLDAKGDLVYIGKAKDLRKRLSQYRNAKRIKAHKKMRRIVRASKTLLFEETATEADALLRENALIKEHRPKLNVDGAFSFLYPTVGLKRSGRHLHLAYSTDPDALEAHGFERFGCYRNRRIARAGFDSLIHLLGWLGHMEGAPESVPYTAWRRFRQIPESFDTPLGDLLRGDSNAFLKTAVVALLDKPAARRDSGQVQTSVNAIKRFFETEAARYKTLRESTGIDYIPNDERDQAMIRASHSHSSDHTPAPTSGESS